jgi:hypothetical protein
MTQVPADQAVPSTGAVDPLEKAASQYEEYIALVALAQVASPQQRQFPEFYAPLPGPLTLAGE